MEMNQPYKLNPIAQSKPRPASPKAEPKRDKNLLKGKPIIFVGGGPGTKRISFSSSLISVQ